MNLPDYLEAYSKNEHLRLMISMLKKENISYHTFLAMNNTYNNIPDELKHLLL